MKIHFDEAADAADVAAELNDQQSNAEAGNEPLVAANDNSLRWPLIPFPDDWYASC